MLAGMHHVCMYVCMYVYMYVQADCQHVLQVKTCGMHTILSEKGMQ